MALSVIDLAEHGFYAESSKCPYASRLDVAKIMRFYVYPQGGGVWVVQRAGGSYHVVRVCVSGSVLMADCDCGDWRLFGSGYRRPCIHIWNVLYTQSIGAC